MDEGLAPSRDQRTIDKQHLNLLSVFHFIGAGFALLGIAFVVLHYAVFSTVMNNPALWEKNPAAAPPPGFFDMFRWFYAVMGGWFGSSLVLNLLAGFYLRSQKHRTFCFVVAGTNCLYMPLGAVLGIFTIVVLARDSVGAAFKAGAHAAYRVD